MHLKAETIDLLKSIFERFEFVQAVYLLGSYASGQANQNSDIDLAIVAAPGVNTGKARLELLADLTDAGLDNIDLAFLDREKLVLAYEAVRRHQLLFSRPDFDSGSFYSRIVRLYLDFIPYLRVQREALKKRLTHGPA